MPEEKIQKLLMEWTPREKRKRGRRRKTWMEEVQSARQQEIKKQINGETERNGVWFLEDGDSC